jgi:hypothetical protein
MENVKTRRLKVFTLSLLRKNSFWFYFLIIPTGYPMDIAIEVFTEPKEKGLQSYL